jgi:hypothetical protein
MAVTIGSISTALLGFAGSAQGPEQVGRVAAFVADVADSAGAAARHAVARRDIFLCTLACPHCPALACPALLPLQEAGSGLIEFIACVLLPVAILMCGYAVSAGQAHAASSLLLLLGCCCGRTSCMTACHQFPPLTVSSSLTDCAPSSLAPSRPAIPPCAAAGVHLEGLADCRQVTNAV